MKTIAPCVLLAVLAAAPASAGVAAVWAVGDGDKVARDAARSPLAKGNAAWDGRPSASPPRGTRSSPSR